MQWCSASGATPYGAWSPPTSVAEPAASPSRLGADLPPYIPSERDLNVLISAVESVASYPYDNRTPYMLPPLTPKQCFAAAPSIQAPPQNWGGSQLTAVGICDQEEMPAMHSKGVAQHAENQSSQTNVTMATSPSKSMVVPAEAKKSTWEPSATPQSRRSRRCQVPDCTKAAQTKGRCVRHGGGKRCSVNGCSRAAQTHGTCKSHGGGTRCSVQGCSKASQGGGHCRRHGGGKLCEFPGCTKGAQCKGKCCKHKGVRVCSVIGCAQPVFESGNLCSTHGEKPKGFQ